MVMNIFEAINSAKLENVKAVLETKSGIDFTPLGSRNDDSQSPKSYLMDRIGSAQTALEHARKRQRLVSQKESRVEGLNDIKLYLEAVELRLSSIARQQVESSRVEAHAEAASGFISQVNQAFASIL